MARETPVPRRSGSTDKVSAFGSTHLLYGVLQITVLGHQEDRFYQTIVSLGKEGRGKACNFIDQLEFSMHTKNLGRTGHS